MNHQIPDLNAQLFAAQQQRAAVDTFIAETARSIYVNRIVAMLADPVGEPIDRDEMTRVANGAKNAALVFAETLGLVQLSKKPTVNSGN